MDEGAKGDKDDASVLPSSRYLEIEGPGRLLRRRAADPRPVLPKAHGVRTWKGTAREREPLVSCLTGGCRQCDGVAEQEAGRSTKSPAGAGSSGSPQQLQQRKQSTAANQLSGVHAMAGMPVG